MNYNDGLSAADVAVLSNRNNGGFGNGFGWGGDASWLIMIFIIFALFGNNGFGGFGGFGGGAFPFLMNNATDSGIQRGFDQSAVMSGINALNSTVNTGFANQAVSQCNQTTTLLQGLNGIQHQLCDNRYDVTNAITTTGYTLNNTMMANEMARQQCCCETKQAIGDLKYTVATENCADRSALQEGVRDIIASNTANTQAILDKLCQQEIDAKNDLIANLRTQLNMADLKASQTAQNAFITQGFANEVDALYNRLNNCPVATVPVYGRQPIFTCNNNNCGCNCGNL